MEVNVARCIRADCTHSHLAVQRLRAQHLPKWIGLGTISVYWPPATA